MDRHKEKRLPPTPSGDRGNLENLGSPLSEGAYSHPRVAPAPPATSSTAAYSPTAPTFPLRPLPGLNDYTQLQPQLQSRPQPPLRSAPWRTPTSPPRPPPGRLFERPPLSQTPQRPAQKTSRSGSLPSINFSQRQTGEQQWQPHHSPRPVTPHPSHGVRSPPSQYGRSAIPPVPPVTVPPPAAAGATAAGFHLPLRQWKPSTSSPFSNPPAPAIPERSPRRSVAGNDSTTEKRMSTVSRQLDVLEEQLVGLRVPLGETRRGEYHGEARRGEYHGEARKGEYNAEARRRQSTNSIYSQGSEEQGSVYAETYHGFMFSDHPHGEPSHKGHLNRPEREGDNQNREPPTTTARTPSPPHYRRPNTPIAPPPIEPRASRLEGRHGGEVEPTTSPTPIRTITATRITRKQAKLRPISTQQAVRTPSPLSGTLKGPGPHVPDVSHGAHLETFTVGGGDDTGSGSDGGGGGRPMFARELTASPEVMSFVAEPAGEEDERRGMVSRWSMDLSDSSDEEVMDREVMDVEVMDVEVMDVEVSPVYGSPTREAEREAGQESAQKPSEEYHEAQEVAQETPSAQDSTSTSSSSSSSSSSNSEPSPASQEHKGTEQQRSEGSILPFNNLSTQLSNLQASLNHLVSQATSVEAAFGQVRDAMIAVRQKATETLVDVEQFLEEIGRVEEELGELRRVVEGKRKEKEVVHSGAGERQGTREEENGGQGERNGTGNHQGIELEQDRKREARREGQQRPEEPQGPPKPRRGPPSGPAPGGAEWV